MLELRAAALSRVAEEHGEALSSQQVAALGEAPIPIPACSAHPDRATAACL